MAGRRFWDWWKGTTLPFLGADFGHRHTNPKRQRGPSLARGGRKSRLVFEPLEQRSLLSATAFATVQNVGTAGIAEAVIYPVGSSSLEISEAGGTAKFAVSLTLQPADTVTIPLESTDTTAGVVSPDDLIFTPTDWGTAQTVTITGVDDCTVDGNKQFSVDLGHAQSDDPNYNGLSVPPISATSEEADTASFSAETLTPKEISQGQTAQFSVNLTSIPSAGVTIPITASDPSAVSLSGPGVTFDSASDSWTLSLDPTTITQLHQPVTVTVTAVNDNQIHGSVSETITLGPATSNDGNYNGQGPTGSPLPKLTIDDPIKAGVAVAPNGSLETTSFGGKASFSVSLTSIPSANVTIPLVSTNLAAGTVSPASLVFTAANWNQPQTVTVTGVVNRKATDNVAYAITLGPAASLDNNYNQLALPAVSAVSYVPVNLGTIGFADQTVTASGSPCYSFSTGSGSLLTVEAVAENGGSVQLALFDSKFNPLSSQDPAGVTPVLSAGSQRIDRQVSSKQTYYVQLTGTYSSADLRIADLISIKNGAVTVRGSGQNDSLSFSAGATRVLTVDGVGYSFTTSALTSLSYVGGKGSSTVMLTGSPGNDVLTMKPDSATLTGSGYKVTISNATSISVDGGGGQDTASLTASTGANDIFYESNVPGPNSALGAEMTDGKTYSNWIDGFANVTITNPTKKTKKLANVPSALDYAMTFCGSWSQ